MDSTFTVGIIAAMAVITAATIWIVKRLVKPPTPAGKRRLAIFLGFVVVQSIIVTTVALLSVEHLLQPRVVGLIGLVNFVVSFLILWAALKRAPISEEDVTNEQRARAVRGSKLLIAIYLVGLINALFHVRELPPVAVVAGLAVNLLILTALITNLRRQQARLKAREQ